MSASKLKIEQVESNTDQLLFRIKLINKKKMMQQKEMIN